MKLKSKLSFSFRLSFRLTSLNYLVSTPTSSSFWYPARTERPLIRLIKTFVVLKLSSVIATDLRAQLFRDGASILTTLRL